MDRELRKARVRFLEPEQEKEPVSPPPKRDWRKNAKKATELDIALIGAIEFSRHTCQRGVELCMTSLHKINKRIEELKGPVDSDNPEIEEIKEQLLERY